MTFFNGMLKDLDKNKLYRAALILFAGIIILIIGRGAFFQKQTQGTGDAPAPTSTPRADENPDPEKELETRLERILALADGAGAVRVMITIAEGEEIFVQRDENNSESISDETDAAGGKRTESQASSESKTVMVRQADGGETPLVLTKAKPRVEGVIIIAEGGGAAEVREALTRAAQAALGVEAHKVQVLKMKSKS